jgi:hypothetical protein
VSNADDIVETYLPLVEELHADIVTIQMASLDQEGLIELLGAEVLPRLRQAAADPDQSASDSPPVGP